MGSVHRQQCGDLVLQLLFNERGNRERRRSIVRDHHPKPAVRQKRLAATVVRREVGKENRQGAVREHAHVAGRGIHPKQGAVPPAAEGVRTETRRVGLGGDDQMFDDGLSEIYHEQSRLIREDEAAAAAC